MGSRDRQASAARSTTRRSADTRAAPGPAPCPPALRGAGVGPTLRQTGPETRARLVTYLQRSSGNAAVTGMLLQREPRGALVGTGLAAELGALLPVGEAPFAVDIDRVLETIRAAPVAERQAAYMDAALRGGLITHLGEEGRDRALSALLDGPRYEPGPEADEYKGLKTEERQPIDLETNALFLRETGIARALDWKAETDKPLARRWLTIRDKVMLAQAQRKRHQLYLEKLREAVQLLSDARRGHGVHFGRATDKRRSGRDNYDLAYWERFEEVDPDGKADAALRLKDGVPPSVAIDELFENLDSWAFDCAEFVQVAHLYARRHTLGDLFDDPRLFDESGGTISFVLRPQGSTGLLQRRMFGRQGRDEPMKRIPGGEEEPQSVDALLAAAPVGSRMVWRNQLAPQTSDRFNENAIKLGPDEFGVHGLARKKVLTRAELELALAQTQEPDADQTYVDDNVFIVGIEHFVTP